MQQNYWLTVRRRAEFNIAHAQAGYQRDKL
jgi:hypothetical protein